MDAGLLGALVGITRGRVCTQGVALGWYVSPRWGLGSADYFTLGGFGHLGGPIMGSVLCDLLLNSCPLKRPHPIQPCAEGYLFYTPKSEVLCVHIFAKQGVIPTM